MKALRSGQTNSWRHAQWETMTRQETATHKGALRGPGSGLMYPLVTAHLFPPGNTMHPIRVCWCMILHFPWCNLVLWWWYQMYLIAENPKCLFWITAYHVPNLDPRSWIWPASAEFCFFGCPSHSALIHKVQQKSYHHKSINRKSYPRRNSLELTWILFIPIYKDSCFPSKTRHGLEASSTPTPPCDKCGWCWLGALPRQWLWRTVETILYLDAGGRNWGWLKQLT